MNVHSLSNSFKYFLFVNDVRTALKRTSFFGWIAIFERDAIEAAAPRSFNIARGALDPPHKLLGACRAVAPPDSALRCPYQGRAISKSPPAVWRPPFLEPTFCRLFKPLSVGRSALGVGR